MAASGFDRPAKDILVPGANLRGLVSHLSIFSKSQLPPMPASTDEKAKPCLPWPISSPSVPKRLGPMPLAPPELIVWHAVHFANTVSPLDRKSTRLHSSH